MDTWSDRAAPPACSGCYRFPCQCDPLPGYLTGPAELRLSHLRARLLDSAALDSIPDPEPLLGGLLQLNSLAVLYGKPDTFKSVVALDWSGHIANGLAWHGEQVTQGPVLYVVAEGESGLRRRVRAWEHHTGTTALTTWLPEAVQILHPDDLAAFTALVTEVQPVLVVIDTLSRCMVGFDELTREMTMVSHAVGQIRNASGACVLLLHHEPRSGENMRGAIALEGAASSVFRATRTAVEVTLTNMRQRDVALARPARLRPSGVLESVVVDGIDESHGPHETLASSSATEAAVLETLRDPECDPGGLTPITLRAVTGCSKATVFRVLKSLVGAGVVIKTGEGQTARYRLAPPGRVS